MPYNTRRKSLSLSELGIQIPKRARAGTTSTNKSLTLNGTDEPAQKKPRCSPSPLASPPLTATTSEDVPIRTAKPIEQIQQLTRPTPLDTPPTSPKAEAAKVDTEGIRDDVVVAVIERLEQTANRPHTSKELAAVLTSSVPTVTSSTNPNALIQARLANYLKAHWPIISPCPLGKQHETVHPRRVFYHLTTMHVQPIPVASAVTAPPLERRIISPALSCNTDEEPDDTIRARFVLSPSPEVNLSSPDLEDEHDVSTSALSFQDRTSLSRDSSTTSLSLLHNRRAISPPLEREERDFKQTANELQEERRRSQQASRKSSVTKDPAEETTIKIEEGKEIDNVDAVIVSVEDSGHDSEESLASSNKEAVASLFGGLHNNLGVPAHTPFELSSPLIKPQHVVRANIDTVMSEYNSKQANDFVPSWGALDDLQSPETVDFDELESLLDAC